MNLYEHEGKELLRRHGLATPEGLVISRGQDAERSAADFMAARAGRRFVLKAQVLAGKRADIGGITYTDAPEEAAKIMKRWFEDGLDGKRIEAALIEERVGISREWYASCAYDSAGPILLFGEQGGTGVEQAGEVKIFRLDPRTASLPEEAAAHLASLSPALAVACTRIVAAFFKEDARQIEVNPLADGPNGPVALDAKIALDDAAIHRHADRSAYPERTVACRVPTERERAARKIDEGDYRGTAGSYLELDGDIAVLCSGGGASLVCMDALIANGLSPANYSEYSGNPPRERVRALTDVVLSKPGLRGLLIAGGVANFTDVKETFAGIADALDVIKPRYPIVVRRAGPNEREGMELMRACAERNGLRMELFGKETPLHEAAAALARLMTSL